MNRIVFFLLILMASFTVRAELQTLTLDLPTMNCAVCPITVKKSLIDVDGVTSAEVSYQNKQAVVTFDDAKTNAKALIEATTNAGYPSTVKN